MPSTHEQFSALQIVAQDIKDKAQGLATACTVAVLCGAQDQAAGYALEWQRWRVALTTILDLQTDLLLLDISDSLAPDAVRVEADS